jgi:hypothetical protein
MRIGVRKATDVSRFNNAVVVAIMIEAPRKSTNPLLESRAS